MPDVPPDDAAEVPEVVTGAAFTTGLPDLEGLEGGMLGGLLAQAQEMMAAQAAAAEQEVEGVAGGGVVRIRATGAGRVLGVRLAPEVVDPTDVGMLEDLVLAALHDVDTQLQELQREAMGPLGDLLGGG
ncbi:MAG: YbaB/EbfC family nucleoid-associated protein [Acidimicrobiales bacterium]|nr:YbaB/EbfC family nucleoid-associated protein [Acidimicrobiales bacterium]